MNLIHFARYYSHMSANICTCTPSLSAFLSLLLLKKPLHELANKYDIGGSENKTWKDEEEKEKEKETDRQTDDNPTRV